MQAAGGMADNATETDLRAWAALGIARLAHALIRLILAAILFALPAAIAYVLWRWLAG
jgi:hypothetical protein